MARYFLIFAALLALPAACDLSLEEDNPAEVYPDWGPPGFPPGYYSVGGTAGAGGGGALVACRGDYDCAGGWVCEGWACPESRCGAVCVERGPSEPSRPTDSTPPDWASQGGAAGSTNTNNTSACPLPDAGLADGGTTAPSGSCDRPAVCLTNDECEGGLCVNNRCQSLCVVSADCRADEACVLGLCRAETADLECIAASNCPTSDDCVGGRCLRRCFTNDHCAGCDDGPVCSTGYCGP